ncbi:peptidase S8 [Planctomyces bekefii]|uniref:Peptidase S8 n=1 Tax=Planctomyces bekefii TaxID=1653850 RepID=A0A5C6M7V4_9PLAN|nr:peptidase S8 [Planctomyces bekefii]
MSIDDKATRSVKEDTVRQVVIKLREGIAPAEGELTLAQLGQRGGKAKELVAKAGPLAFSRYVGEQDLAALSVGVADASIRTRTVGEQSARGKGWAELRRYLVADLPPDVDPQSVAKALAELDEVESAYVPGGPTPPPVNAADDPLARNQGYLDAAPGGIDARFAWGYADGLGAEVVDLERGWTLDHEDLASGGITLISGVNKDFHGHGTAVLGEIVGVDNMLGVVGIAPRARARVVSQWRTSTNYNTAAAIASAAASMRTGDVLLLEAQTVHANAAGYVPVEVEDAVFDAIRAATDDGIIVVEAGANGAVDLDAFSNSAGKRILNRAHSDFRDSGAIMVGAASSAAPHTRLSFSNFGSRIDCFAWGEGIQTTGDGWLGTSTTAYTPSFSGTSGASPIVTGAALLLQSWRRARGNPYSPSVMRSLLSNASLNTPSASPDTDLIGVMPNLRAIIESQRVRRPLEPWRWKLMARILFGVTADGGGLIWVPGRGPVPIDPWGPLQIEDVTPEVRNALAAMAVYEMATLNEDSSSASSMQKAALSSLRSAADRLEAKLAASK